MKAPLRSEFLYQYNPWWEGSFTLENVVIRQQPLAQLQSLLNDKAVVFLTGLRRVGKTTLIKLLIQSLLDASVNPRAIFYISLDDYLLRDHSIIEIVDEYRTLLRIPISEKIYLFFDEIGYKEDFRLQLKNLYDKGNVKIYASSSSSSVLRDKRGFLTGRERVIPIEPLSFHEFLIFKNITIKKSDAHLLKPYFEDYLKVGGMPEYVLHENREYLMELVDDIIYKDIVGYHGIKNPNMIKDYFMLLMERVGKQVSLNKVANILGISPDSAKRYLYLFEDTFLIELVSRVGKTNETILSQKKIYAADLGIRNLFTGFRDKGALFENVVYSMIKHLRPKYVFHEAAEIDFLTENKILIEVKYGQELNSHQEKLFEKYKAKKKIVIKGVEDLPLLEELQHA